MKLFFLLSTFESIYWNLSENFTVIIDKLVIELGQRAVENAIEVGVLSLFFRRELNKGA